MDELSSAKDHAKQPQGPRLLDTSLESELDMQMLQQIFRPLYSCVATVVFMAAVKDSAAVDGFIASAKIAMSRLKNV
jgi:phosphoribosyl-dephospho-CoA transferase